MADIDEVYCRGIRAVGSHATWVPGSRAWPGDYGEYRGGIFTRLGSMLSLGYSYVTEPDQNATILLTSKRVVSRAVSVAGQVSDPLEILAAARGRVSFGFSDENEVALMTLPGTWHGVVFVEKLLAQVQKRIERWSANRLIVCSAFETDWGIAAVSSGASRTLEIGLGAKGTAHGAVKVGGDLAGSVRWDKAAGWTSPFSSPEGLSAQPVEPRSSKSTPLFGQCYRIKRKYLNKFGPRRIEDIDGHVIEINPDLLTESEEAHGAGRAEAIAALKTLDVFELFELLTPQTVNEELDEERGVLAGSAS